MTRSTLAAWTGIATLAGLLVAADAAHAGGPHHGRGPGGPGGPDARGLAGERPAPALEALDLTEDQRSQLAVLRETFRSEVEALRASGSATRADAEALRDAHREQVQAILTAEQVAQLETLRAQRDAVRPEGPEGIGGERGRRPGRRGDRIGPPSEGGGPLSAVDLSEDQRTEIEALRDELHAQMRALRESGTATREEARTLMEAHREAVHALLTEAQKAQLEERIAQRPDGRSPHGPFGPPPPEAGPADDGMADDGSAAGAAKAAAATESSSWGQMKQRVGR